MDGMDDMDAVEAMDFAGGAGQWLH